MVKGDKNRVMKMRGIKLKCDKFGTCPNRRPLYLDQMNKYCYNFKLFHNNKIKDNCE